MYQIIGIQRNQQQRLIATPSSAREALTHYRAAQKLFTRIVIHTSEGEEINGFELNRLAEAERLAEERKA